VEKKKNVTTKKKKTQNDLFLWIKLLDESIKEINILKLNM